MTDSTNRVTMTLQQRGRCWYSSTLISSFSLFSFRNADQLFQLLDKGLDDRDAGEILLREV